MHARLHALYFTSVYNYNIISLRVFNKSGNLNFVSTSCHNKNWNPWGCFSLCPCQTEHFLCGIPEAKLPFCLSKSTKGSLSANESFHWVMPSCVGPPRTKKWGMNFSPQACLCMCFIHHLCQLINCLGAARPLHGSRPSFRNPACIVRAPLIHTCSSGGFHGPLRADGTAKGARVSPHYVIYLKACEQMLRLAD